MAAFTASQASINNGSKVVKINSGESIANVGDGDFLVIANFIVEINRAYVSATNEQLIELVENWPNSNQNNQKCIVIPTTGAFKKAVDALTNANLLVNNNFTAMQDWQTKTGTVTFSNQDGTTTTVKTLKQIEADNLAQMNAYHPYPWAMRKVEFESIRAANNKKYAASGFVHLGKHYSGGSANEVPINQGLNTSLSEPNTLRIGRGGSALKAGNSRTDLPVINISGVLSVLDGICYPSSTLARINIVKLPPTEDGTRTYNSATGISVTHATAAIAFASETETNKVVTDRVDMWGFEAFLREINDSDPFVYKNGLIQSLATDINGVATVSDTVRAITYFAWYEGDTSSRGKGVNWQTASEDERIAIANDQGNTNRIYFDDATGKFYQWSIRGRSFAGISNGDWVNVDPNNALNLESNTGAIVTPQGTSDTGGFGTTWATSYGVYRSEVSQEKGNLGLFTPALSSGGLTNRAVGGQCYFLVCGTVNRKNQGAHHPSFNDYGARAWNRRDGGGNTPFHLYNNFGGTTGEMSRLTAFQNGRESSNDGIGYAPNSGFISSTGSPQSGSPDNGLCDAIASSGKGGVCRDMRYSARGLRAENFAEADLKIKSGNYRGLEKDIYSKVVVTTHSSSLLSEYIWISSDERQPIAERDYVFLLENGSWTKYLIRNASKVDNRWDIRLYGAHNRAAGELAVIEYKDGPTQAGIYYQKDVIGDPAQIVLIEELQNGWGGSWLPVVPSGTALEFKFTKPLIGEVTRYFTENTGDSWSSSGITEDFVKNSYFASLPATSVGIYIYGTRARMTTPSTVSSIDGGASDVGYLFSSMDSADSKGRIFGFSLTGKISSHPSTSDRIGLEVSSFDSLPLLPATGILWGANISAGELRHSPLKLSPPFNESSAFKALNYNVTENQQAFINYAYTELTYDATAGDWGDDSKVHIADNQATMPDENGNTVLVGTARCVESLGWIKNDK